MLSRVRQCNWCKANIRGYDHHCPAFGTCIGIIFQVPCVYCCFSCGLIVVGTHSNPQYILQDRKIIGFLWPF
jgi:hypothetical protein